MRTQVMIGGLLLCAVFCLETTSNIASAQSASAVVSENDKDSDQTLDLAE